MFCVVIRFITRYVCGVLISNWLNVASDILVNIGSGMACRIL